MKKVVLIGALMIQGSMPAMAAGPFFNAQWGFYRGEIGEFELQPTHPVTSTTGDDRKDQDDGFTLQLGYMFANGWYGTVGHTSFGEFTGFVHHAGADSTFTYNSNIRRDENVDAWSITVGKSFPVAAGFALFGDVGIHRFEIEAKERNELVQTEIASPTNTTITTIRDSSTDSDTGAVYTAGWSMELHGGAVFTMSYSKYGELDYKGANVSLRWHF